MWIVSRWGLLAETGLARVVTAFPSWMYSIGCYCKCKSRSYWQIERPSAGARYLIATDPNSLLSFDDFCQLLWLAYTKQPTRSNSARGGRRPTDLPGGKAKKHDSVNNGGSIPASTNTDGTMPITTMNSGNEQTMPSKADLRNAGGMLTAFAPVLMSGADTSAATSPRNSPTPIEQETTKRPPSAAVSIDNTNLDHYNTNKDCASVSLHLVGIQVKKKVKTVMIEEPENFFDELDRKENGKLTITTSPLSPCCPVRSSIACWLFYCIIL